MRQLLLTIFLIILFITPSFADETLTAQTELTSPTSDDLMYIVDNDGTPNKSRKITLENIFNWFVGEDWTVTGTWDFSGATVTGVQADLSLVAGTYTDGYLCTYTTTGTLLDCNTNPADLGTGLTEIPVSGEITDEQVACWETSETPGTNKLKSCGAKTTDNSTATHLLCKDDSGEIENCTLAGLAISGTTSPTITVESVPSNATVNAAGEVTVDTTTDQFRWYGTAQQQLSPKLTFGIVVPSVADTDDMLIMKAPYGMTITALDCIVSAATSATINIQECDSAGANCTDTATSDLACDTDGANTTTLNNAAIDSGDWLKLDVASVSGTPGTLTVTVTYTVVAD